MGARTRHIHGTIAHDLGIKIVSGQYKPGEVLRGEVIASDRLHVSRTAYREAMRILIAKGLVEQRPKFGTRVTPREQWYMLDPDVLAWIFEAEPDQALFAQLFELRRIIEPEAAALAASRRTKKELVQMAAALDGMAKYGLAFDLGRHADQDFHHTILRASRNMFLASLVSGISAAISWTTIFRLRKQSFIRDGVPDHRLVYDAIAAADPGAAHDAMTRLIDLALLDIKSARRAAK